MKLSQMDDWTFFEALAQSSSLTEAGLEWGVSVPAISRRLSELERRLGAQLVRRSTRGLQLTTEGERYAAGLSEILIHLTDLEDSVSAPGNAPRGKLAIQSAVGLGRTHIAPLVSEFSDAHPELEIELELSHLPHNIAGTRFDIGIRVGRLSDSELHFTRLHSNSRVLCASPAYLHKHGVPETLQDLHSHKCIILKDNEGEFDVWRFGDSAVEESVRVAGSMTTNDGDIATGWCLDGRGLLMRSLWHVAPLLASGHLVRVLPRIPTPAADIYAVYPRSRFVLKRVTAMVDHLKTGLALRLVAS